MLKLPLWRREKLLQTTWIAGVVENMLANDGSDVSRPDGLSAAYGLQQQDKRYRLSEVQAQAILELRLQRLTALEQDKIFAEYKELLQEIQKLLAILAQPELLTDVVRQELLAVKEEFGDARRTEIIDDQKSLTHEDLITPENVGCYFVQRGAMQKFNHFQIIMPNIVEVKVKLRPKSRKKM